MDPLYHHSPFGDYFGSPYSGLGSLVGGGQAPFSNFQPPQFFSGFEGSPLGMFGDMGTVAGAFLHPMLQQQMGGMGYSPIGAGHGVNPWQVMRSQRYHENRMDLLRGGASQDAATIARILQGASAMPGVAPSAANQRAASRMGDAISGILPFVAGTPFEDFLDASMGRQGSAAVMTSRMTPSMMQRYDPSSGRTGMDVGSARAFAGRMFDDVRSNFDEYGGLSAGQMGSVFHEMSGRGMIRSGTAGSMDRNVRSAVRELSPVELAQVSKRTGVDFKPGQDISAEDVEKAKIDPTVVDKLRQFDFNQNKIAMKEMGRAMSAMKDIFGEHGNPNAPFSQIMAGLSAITGGQLNNRAARGGLSQQIRETYNLARTAGLGLEQTMNVFQDSFARAQQFGAGNETAASVAKNSIAFYGAALGNTAAGWNAKTADQLMQADNARQLSFSKSQVGNNLGLLLRMQKLGGFEKGSKAAELFDAVQRGEVSPDSLRTTQLREVMIGAKNAAGEDMGIDASGFNRMVLQGDQNEEALTRDPKAAGLGRKLQWEGDIKPFMARVMQRPIADALVRAGLSRKEAMEKAKSMAGDVLDRRTEIGQDDMADATKRAKRFGDLMREEAEKRGVRGLGNLDATMSGMFGDVDRQVQRKFGGPKGLNAVDIFNMDNPEIQAQAAKNDMKAKVEGRIQDKLAALGSGGIVARASSALQKADPNDPDSLKRILAESFGVKNKDVVDRLAGVLKGTQGLKDKLLGGAAEDAVAGEDKQLNEAIKELAPMLEKLKPELDKKMKEEAAQAAADAKKAAVMGRVGEGYKTKAEAKATLEKRDAADLSDEAVEKEFKEGKIRTLEEAEALLSKDVKDKEERAGEVKADKADGAAEASSRKMQITLTSGELTVTGSGSATLKGVGTT